MGIEWVTQFGNIILGKKEIIDQSPRRWCGSSVLIFGVFVVIKVRNYSHLLRKLREMHRFKATSDKLILLGLRGQRELLYRYGNWVES